MDHTDSAPSLAVLLDQLVSDAVDHDVPSTAAEHARQATSRWLRSPMSEPVSARTCRRAEAYFSAVVRRQVVQRGAPARAAARFVVAAVVADLRTAGRDADGIWSELERGWSERVPCDVLEEFRLRLCG